MMALLHFGYKRSNGMQFIILLGLLLVVLWGSLLVGSVELSLTKIINQLFNMPFLPNFEASIEATIVWSIRLPRILTAACVGAALAVAGAQMQSLLQNPLASPGLLGSSSGAALGAVMAITWGWASWAVWALPVMAVVGAFVALFVVYALSVRHGRASVMTLLLAGIAVNAFIGALTSLVITLVWQDYEMAGQIIFWLLGSLESRTWLHVLLVAPAVIIGVGVAMLYARELDIFLMGQETAESLGVATESIHRIILLNTALLTGCAVAVSGVIGFVGLIIPHLVRMFWGPRHRYLLPICAIMGAIFLVLMDTLARTLLSPQEIRIGILTALLGAPFFLFLLLRQREF
ncbi:FecCD family ABC transporter permease [Thioflexithrix psekupsensis]|nr:iron ABC transporter permease [Thioflexithrix psekupsensis]